MKKGKKILFCLEIIHEPGTFIIPVYREPLYSGIYAHFDSVFYLPQKLA